MSNLIEAITLALVQGITEFIPISSSAHLILVPLLTGWADQGLSFDIAVHIGTLFAVCWYFRREIQLLWAGFWRSLFRHRRSRFYGRLAWQLIIATFPIALIGWLAHDFVATQLRSPLIICCATVCFGLVLLASDYFSLHQKKLRELTWKDIIIIGLAQTLALIPGTSRSGITLTAGLALGYNRESSAKFSFLLSIPVILLAGSFESIKILRSPDAIQWPAIGVAVVFAALSAYGCIHLFLRLLRKIGVLPFVIYRLCLGAFLFFIFL
ncbi:MAG: undecaprenyl-diphosphate phosphatase [Candidatus Berkiellales bacterium]